MIETYLPAVILAALALLVFRLIFGNKKPRKKKAQKKPAHSYAGAAHRQTASHRTGTSRFRAVSCSGDCDAVRGIRGKRFLEREAPALPLPGCMKSRCHCIYVHHDDRRSGRSDRRGSSRPASAQPYGAQLEDRRAGPRGRRASDLAMA